LDIADDPRKGQRILAKAHGVTLPPRPPEGSEEERRKVSSRMVFDPITRINFSEKILSNKTEPMSNMGGESTVPKTMQNCFFIISTSRTGRRGSHLTVVQK
jgi:hypothetical protein